ncbi:MAG: YjjG family noncanonical pyrimidine nucleotidase [Clostridia bacterium]|nr:YjjG family noncanonical pyrimidine nucleotidase [Clostridia bacterium]
MIKYVFFDLDETLFDFPTSERLAISEVLVKFGISPTESTVKRYSEINRYCWDLLELGRITKGELLEKRFVILFSELCVNVSPSDAQAVYENALGSHHPLIHGARELLSELYGKYSIYAVTNGTAIVQDRRIRDSGLHKYFDGVFISERLGYAKPDVRFFEAAFANIKDFDKKLAIIVGDSLRSDILGGKNAGIRTCHYNPVGRANETDIMPDYEIKKLSELPGLLKEL